MNVLDSKGQTLKNISINFLLQGLCIFAQSRVKESELIKSKIRENISEQHYNGERLWQKLGR